MDFNDFINRFNQEYGTSNEDWDTLRKSAIITFDYDDRGNISGRYKGVLVYRNKKFENVILPGETWICSLEPNPSSSANYFAKPLQRIDASFMFEMKKDQIDEICETIWNKYRESIEPRLDEKYSDVVKEKIDNAIDKMKDEYETTIRDLIDQIQRLELTIAENEKIIGSLQNKLSCSESREERSVIPGAGFGISLDVKVRRIGADSIFSEFFDKSRYFVHISADHRTMIVVPHRSGDVVCIDQVITLNGLSMISPFTDTYDMICEYNPNYGGAQIFLK